MSYYLWEEFMREIKMPRQQRREYDIIKAYHAEHGISPSISDIADMMDLAHTTITVYVDIMKKKGFIKSLPNIPRSLTVIAQEPEPVEAPVVDAVSAPVGV
jgi:SOS-response transcriptional repressor LexA